MTTTTKTGLPRIVRFDETTDSGEFGNATCPHCGALGRYTHWFLGEDGKRHGAMSGCIKLFPISRIAEEHKKISEKQRQNKNSRRPKSLNNWDTKKLNAIERYYDGKLTEGQCLAWIDDENRSRDAWMRSKGYR